MRVRRAPRQGVRQSVDPGRIQAGTALVTTGSGSACDLTALYQSHLQRLRSNLLARYTHNRLTSDEVDDAIQEAFLRVLERGSRRPDASEWTNALGYIFTVACNVCSDWRRRRSRERAFSRVQSAAGNSAQSARAEEIELDLQLRWLTTYVGALPDGARAVYTARFVDGLSQEATAHQLVLTRRAVRTLERRLVLDVARRLRAASSDD